MAKFTLTHLEVTNNWNQYTLSFTGGIYDQNFTDKLGELISAIEKAVQEVIDKDEENGAN